MMGNEWENNGDMVGWKWESALDDTKSFQGVQSFLFLSRSGEKQGLIGD